MSITSSRARRLVLAALLALALAAVALPSAASARVKTYQVGDRITFVTVTHAAKAKQYGVYLTVAAKRRADRHGALKRTQIGTFARMTRKRGGRYEYTTPDYTFPDWFMMRPGTYYWQTSYTDCSVPGCKVVSRIRSFKVA